MCVMRVCRATSLSLSGTSKHATAKPRLLSWQLRPEIDFRESGFLSNALTSPALAAGAVHVEISQSEADAMALRCARNAKHTHARTHAHAHTHAYTHAHMRHAMRSARIESDLRAGRVMAAACGLERPHACSLTLGARCPVRAGAGAAWR